MNKYFKSFIAVLALMAGLLIPSVAYAQVTLTSTTLSAAITEASANTIVVASATGFTANTTLAIVDQEAMAVTAVSGTTITVVRGIAGTRATTHANAAVVYVGSPTYFGSVGRAGSCTSANELVLPVVVPTMGMAYNCIGSRWVGTPLITSFGAVGVPILNACGATSGNANCANTRSTGNAFIVTGTATLSAGSAIISAISPTFTSTTSGACVGIDQSGGSGVLAEVVISGVSSLTVSGTGAGVVWYLCTGS